MPTDSAKTILCYGDSNTWGYNPVINDRFPRSVRWTGALQRLLGDGYEVISEGLCGRTFVVEDPNVVHRRGITCLPSILESADPVDLIIIMLGTNDVRTSFGLKAEQIAEHLQQTIDLIRNPKLELAYPPKILIVCPPPVVTPDGRELDKRMVNGPELFKALPGLYKMVAERNGCQFLNAGDYVSNGKIDGYHLDEEAHKKLAETLAEWIQKM